MNWTSGIFWTEQLKIFLCFFWQRRWQNPWVLKGEKKEFCTDNFKFEIHIQYPNRLAKLGVGYMSLEIIELGPGYSTNLGVIRVHIVFKAMKLGEIL